MEDLSIDNWPAIFLLIIFGELGTLIVAYGVPRALVSLLGVDPEINSPRRALLTLATIVPVAGFAGLPFFIIPFWGPIFGTVASEFAEAIMFGEKYEVSQALGAKIIVPTIVAIYIVSGVIVYYGIGLL